MKTISSSQTILMKVVFPVIWITGFGAGTLSMWMGDACVKNGTLTCDSMKFQFLLIWISGTVFILRGYAGLKQVRINSTDLYVSNFLKEISVPLNAIVDVTENCWINIHPVTIHFRDTTEFGQSIRFMPTFRFFGLWSSHPIVAELKRFPGSQKR